MRPSAVMDADDSDLTDNHHRLLETLYHHLQVMKDSSQGDAVGSKKMDVRKQHY
jgi:hypothetical protein